MYIYKYLYIPRERERERTRESTKSYQGTTPTYKVTFFVFFCFELFKGVSCFSMHKDMLSGCCPLFT